MENSYIPDLVELSEHKKNLLEDMYIDDKTCMMCKKKVNTELICVSITGDGPAICEECYGDIIGL